MQALGGGGGVGGGGIGSVAMSTVSKEDNMAMSSEDSSSPDHDTAELELGLGLGIGNGGFYKGVVGGRHGGGGNMGHHYPRFLTAKDLASSSSSSASSTSSCSSSLSRANGTAGTKRSAADSVSPPNGGVVGNQVVGWPPIRAYRMNSMVSHAKSLATEEFNPVIEENENKNIEMQNTVKGIEMNNGATKIRSSHFVKVNMDGIPIGRKINLNAHSCYESLAITLEDMFLRHATSVNGIRSSTLERDPRGHPTRRSKLLDGSSDFVLTYEDKDSDWMLVGDVPWGMFLSSVKRLRIMRTSDATGLAPSIQERNGRQRSKPI